VSELSTLSDSETAILKKLFKFSGHFKGEIGALIEGKGHLTGCACLGLSLVLGTWSVGQPCCTVVPFFFTRNSNSVMLGRKPTRIELRSQDKEEVRLFRQLLASD